MRLRAAPRARAPRSRHAERRPPRVTQVAQHVAERAAASSDEHARARSRSRRAARASTSRGLAAHTSHWSCVRITVGRERAQPLDVHAIDARARRAPARARARRSRGSARATSSFGAVSAGSARDLGREVALVGAPDQPLRRSRARRRSRWCSEAATRRVPAGAHAASAYATRRCELPETRSSACSTAGRWRGSRRSGPTAARARADRVRARARLPVVAGRRQAEARRASSRACAASRANPRVELLLDEYDADWSRLWWLRIEGEARVVSPRRSVARPGRRAGAGGAARASTRSTPRCPCCAIRRPCSPSGRPGCGAGARRTRRSALESRLR